MSTLILTKLRWFQLFVKSQKFEFQTFLKKNPIFGYPWCSTREDLSIDVSITNVGLILTKLRWFQLFVKSQNSNFELFWKKIQFLCFHGVVFVKTFPLMYQLLMQGWYRRSQGDFSSSSKVKIWISNFFEKKNQIFRFPWCSTREDLSIDVSITNVGLILTKLWWYLFSGCGQTDRQTDTVLESSYGNMSAHKKFQLKAQN